MNATDVTGRCAAVQYQLIMLKCGIWNWHDVKPIRWNTELLTVRLLETEMELCDGFPQTPNNNVA